MVQNLFFCCGLNVDNQRLRYDNYVRSCEHGVADLLKYGHWINVAHKPVPLQARKDVILRNKSCRESGQIFWTGALRMQSAAFADFSE
ncbi:hypothetical protein MHYP_G00344120 [Metynnis hypsauchen]